MNCPHYGRDTCLILFKCCNEWYPCHKCHNEAITEFADQHGKESEANNQESCASATVRGETDDLSKEEFEEKSKNIAVEECWEKPESQNVQSLAENVALIDSTHSMATSLDGVQLKCACGWNQMAVSK